MGRWSIIGWRGRLERLLIKPRYGVDEEGMSSR